MIFDKKIHSVVNSEVGHLFSGGVYSHNLPPNFDFRNPTLVLQYKLNNRVATLTSNFEQEDYECQLVIITDSTQKNAEIASEIMDIFEDYEDINIVDMHLVDDLNSVDFDNGYYVKSLNYKIIYNR